MQYLSVTTKLYAYICYLGLWHLWNFWYSLMFSKLILFLPTTIYYYEMAYYLELYGTYNEPSKFYLQESSNCYYYCLPYYLDFFAYYGITLRLSIYFFQDSNCYYYRPYHMGSLVIMKLLSSGLPIYFRNPSLYKIYGFLWLLRYSYIIILAF